MAVFIDRAIRRGLIVACIAVAGHAAPAFALEFGALHVHSNLNQPLDATVELNDLDASERASLDVGIAPPAMFQRFGIRRSSAVDRIQIDTTTTDGGRRVVVHIATNRPVSEPFVDFLLQVESGNGSALREYTAMLNPASEATNTPAAPTRSTTATASQAASSSHSGEATTGSTHQVQPGETLWSIAAANTPRNATVAQTMLAIYRANPSAFNGNMSALSGNARLTIPRATRIRAVNAAKAKQRLVSTRQAATEASAKPASSGRGAAPAGKLAASGQAPPAQLKQNESPATATHADSQSSGPGTTGGGNASQARPAAAGAFGTLSLPSDAPWPAQPATTQGSPATDAGTSTTAAAPAASSTVTSDTNESASDKSAVTTPVATKTTPKTTAKSKPHGPDTPPPSDVSKPESGTWLSPRNLLLLIVLLALSVLVLRRLRERRYKPVELDREPPPEPAAEAEADETPTPSAGASAEAAAGAYRQSPAVDTPAPSEPGSTPMPAAEASPASGARHATRPPEPEAESPAEPVASPELETPYTPPAPIATSEAKATQSKAPEPEVPEPKTSVLQGADELEPVEDEPSAPAQDVAPMRFEPVNAPESGFRLAAHRGAATNEEIEALAFEPQSLPDTTERQHDRGDDSEPGLAFIEPDEQAEPAAAEDGDTADEVRRTDPYGLEMIDPGEFDLYDPPSETAGPTDDDPNHSVEIRLDLARMYLEMDDDQAARELLADVRERGDEQQRDEAGRLLERLEA